MASDSVNWIDPAKEYPFFQPEYGWRDVFVRISAVERAGLTTFSEGRKVVLRDHARPECKVGCRFSTKKHVQCPHIRSHVHLPRGVRIRVWTGTPSASGCIGMRCPKGRKTPIGRGASGESND
ncbi:MAG: cold-shock protein [Alphaproteobacteria bacterium]|nr:cold-shock protein [Alphaproteobacteria bacterium]